MKRESTTIKAGRALLRGGAAATMLFAGNALATEYTVTTLDDNTVNDGDISLREAIDAARTDAAVGDAPAGSADGDSIVFDTGLFAVDPTITLNPALGPLQIGDDLSIDGSGTVPPVTVTVDANDIQAFAIDAAGGAGSMQAVSIANLSITSGFSTTSGGAMIIAAGSEVALDGVGINGSVANGGNADQGGGAIFNAGMLTITGGDFSGNAAPTGSGSGGAIFNADNATLTVSGTLFNNNSAQRAGGAIEARAGSTTTLDGVTLDGNSTGPSPGNGGGLHITGAGDATITGGSVTGNSAANEGGGLWNGFGTMVVDGTTVSGNTASGDGPANGGGGIFNNEGTLQVDGATISGNTADGTSGSGGGILNKGSEMRTGTLSVTGGAISGNTSNRAGGGIEATDFTDTALTDVTLSDNTTGANPGNGGGMHLSGGASATVSGGTVDGNTAASEGGGLWNNTGLMTVNGTTITDNVANGADADNGGGGLFNNTGRMELTDVTVSGNSAAGASGSGGGILNLGPDSAMPDRGVLIVSGGTISDNDSSRAGGGIEATANTTTTLSDGLMLSGNSTGPAPGNGGGLHITGAGDADISDVTVSNNTATAEGGGLWNGAGTMTVADSTIADNSAAGADADQGGGGLFNLAGTLALTDTTVTGNDATGAAGSGGGILNTGAELSVTGGSISDNTSMRAGGGIEDNNSAGSSVITLTSVTFSGNSTGPSPGNGGAFHVTGANAEILVDRVTASGNSAANEGGGLWNFAEASMVVVNSTISGNSATGNGGGGLFNQPLGDLALLNVTVADNTATTGMGGGLLNADTGVVTAVNALIADNTASAGGNDVSGAIAVDYTLIADAGGATIDGGDNVTGTDAGIGDLAANGGPTQTHALMAGSPAAGAGDDATCQGAEVGGIDQRGVTRKSPDCDIGAYELVDGTEAMVGNNSAETVDAAPGDTDVQAVAFSVANDASAVENIAVGGFSGSLDGMGDIAGTLVNPQLYIDANGNGMVDSGESALASAQVSISLDAAAGSFSVDFASDRLIAPGQTENYLLTVDIGTTSSSLGGGAALAMLAGGTGLPLLAIGMIGAPRRRGALAALLVIGGIGLAGCDGSAPRGVVDDNVIVDARFTVEQVDATGASSGLPAEGIALPVEGPRIVVSQ